MKKLRLLLLLVLAAAVCMSANAYAAESPYPDPFAGKVIKIALDSGYQLDVAPLDMMISIDGVGQSYELSEGNGYTVEDVPVYGISVPTGTENVCFYILQDGSGNGGHFSYYGSYYVGIADWNIGDTTAAMEWYDEDQYWIFKQVFANGTDGVTNIYADEEAGVVAGSDEGGLETSLYKVAVPIPEQNLDEGVARLVVFQNYDTDSGLITFPFALYFLEDPSMDASLVATDYINVGDVTSWDATEAGKETRTLAAQIFPRGAVKDASSITWTSSDESIVTVESTGETEYEASYDSVKATAVLTPKGVGSAEITVTCGNYTTKGIVEITAANVQNSAEITLDQSEATLWNIAGQTVPEGYAEQYPGSVTLAATVSPEDAEITWSSSDETVATVENGVVTAVGAGETTITATVGDVSAECKVTVNTYIEQGYTNFAVTSWTDSANKPENVTAKVIDLSDENQPKTATIEASVYKNVDGVKTLSTIQDVKWEVTGTSDCAEISYEGNNAVLNFTETTGSITVWPTTLSGSKNGGAMFYVTEGFTTSNEIVRADGEEWMYVTATVGGSEREDVIQLYVGDEVVVKNQQLPYGNNPDYHVWSLYNYAVNGNTVVASSWDRENMTLTAKQAGTSSLTVWSPYFEMDHDWNNNGSHLTSDKRVSTTVYIQIVEKIDVEAVSLDKTEATIWNIAGQTVPEGYAEQYSETVTLTATVTPDNATDKTVVWTSSDENVATVENGVVTAVCAGETIITASAGNVSAECKVTVSEYVEQAYTNVAVENWQDSANKPDGVTAKVIDLTDENQPKTVTIIGSAYKNVGDDEVKTLSTIQDCTWNITGDTDCVTYTTEGNTITLTITGEPGVVNVQPVLLNGYKNVSIPLYITNGFVTDVSIVREDGDAWEYGEKETIGGTEYDVVEIVKGSSITAVSSATNVTQTYNGWMVQTLDDSYAMVSTGLSFNGASMDLSKLDIGLYGVLVRVPMYEQNVSIDPLKGSARAVSSDMIYIRVVEEPEVVLGDVDSDGSVNTTDARRIMLYSANKVALNEEQLAAADVNDDGEINTTDARRILLFTVGKISELK